MNRTIGFKERRYIEELRILTKATAIDCVIDERFDRVVYVIRKGDMGLAIGKRGENIKRLQSVLGKRVEMVEAGETILEFVQNIFRPAHITKVEEQEGGHIDIFVQKRGDLGLTIGKAGSTIEKGRALTMRFFGCTINDIQVEPGDESREEDHSDELEEE
ncbi:MAG: NusA-like transcription termination signal-binding factor [Methanomicrobiales archaeon]|jgi:N utilization substance protein A|nr:NusA-like transcription termination signal-binding factor [Methanomicrobiales archaeon]